MRITVRIATTLLLLVMISLALLVGLASARWNLGDGEMYAVERICRDGLIYAAQYNLEPIEWDQALDGEVWSEDGRTAVVYPAAIDIEDQITASVGPTEDPAPGVENLAHFTVLRWVDELNVGDAVRLQFSMNDDVYVFSLIISATVTNCTIADDFPAPALYQVCNLPINGDITNGDFEQGPVAWVQYSSNGYPLIYDSNTLPVPPHGGLWAAWLSGLDEEISYIEQSVPVPVGRSTLSYWHWIISNDYCGYDFAFVRVNGSDVDSYDLCNDTGGWVQHSVDLSSYAGQTVSLQLRTQSDSSYISSLFIDDVSFQFGSPQDVSWAIPFPADIEILDLDFLLYWDQWPGEQPVSAALSSPEGTAVQLFNNLAQQELGYTCELFEFGGSPFVLDDEGEAPVSDYPVSGGLFYIPTEALSVYDGMSTLGQWDLTMTGISGYPESGNLLCGCVQVIGNLPSTPATSSIYMPSVTSMSTSSGSLLHDSSFQFGVTPVGLPKPILSSEMEDDTILSSGKRP